MVQLAIKSIITISRPNHGKLGHVNYFVNLYLK